MTLIDVYIQEVTRRLPEKSRKDIGLELRSTIEDMLPEQYSEKEVKETLATLGNPATLAAGYVDRPMHFIGPRYYNLFITLLKLIIPIVALITLIVVIVEKTLTYNGEEAVLSMLLNIIGEGIWGVLSASIQTFFWITLAIAIVERTDTSSNKGPVTASLQEWTPEDLKNIPYIKKEKRISYGELIGSIIWIAIFAVVYFNAVHLVGVYEKVQGKLQLIIPTFNQEVLHSFWLLILVSIALEISLVIYKFKVGQWTKKVAIWNLFRNLISALIFAVIMTHADLVNSEFITYLEQLFNISLDKMRILYGVIALFLVFAVIDIIQGIRKAAIR